MRLLWIVATSALLSACCDWKDGEVHVVARNGGCTVYQVACDHVFYTRCEGSAKVTTNVDWMVCVGCGKSMCCHTDMASNDTFGAAP